MTGERPAPRPRCVAVRRSPLSSRAGIHGVAAGPFPGVRRGARLRGRDSLRLRHASLPVGSRQGPDAIREQSRLLRPVDIFRRHGIDNPSEFLRAVDVGNVACHPGDPDASFPLIEAGIGAILDAGAIPISMGGDGAVTLPQLRVARRHPDFAVLHFDSHTDTYPIPGYNTATTFTRAAEGRSAGCGAQFPCWHARQLLHARRAGIRP